MIVLLSDIHLTDGSSGETIKAYAFKKFTDILYDMVVNAQAKELEVVLLGDIFDVIRSGHWLNSDNTDGSIRPWSSEKDKDSKGKTLKDYTVKIVDDICKTNKESIQHLISLKKRLKDEMQLDMKMTYIIGNHDWLINRYAETRTKIQKLLNLEDDYSKIKFDTEFFKSEYKVFARHGDIYDQLNYDGNRDASSIGDAIVIDILNKFPLMLKKQFEDSGTVNDVTNNLVIKLKEIDNVRPLFDIPSWIHGVSKNTPYEDVVKKVWNKLVNEFFKIQFISSKDIPLWPDVIDGMKILLSFSQYSSLKSINSFVNKFSGIINFAFSTEDTDYLKKAYKEYHRKANLADFIIYGHTHHYKIYSMDAIESESETTDQIYFNTGTWRKIHSKTHFDPENCEFSGWDVMTFIAFYLENERGNRKFEVWHGALG